MHVQLTGLPMLPWSHPPLSHNVLARDIMSSPVIVLRPVEKVATVMQVLRSCPHQGFPIVDQTTPTTTTAPAAAGVQAFGSLRGLILRSQLKVFLHFIYFN